MEEMRERLAEVEAQMGNMASMSELEESTQELADASTVEDVEKALSEMQDTVEDIASEPEGTKTLADSDGWEPEYDLSPSPDTGF